MNTRSLKSENNIITVSDINELREIVDKEALSTKNHLVILSHVETMKPELEKICTAGDIYSLTIVGDSNNETAHELTSETVPIFIAENKENAISQIKNLLSAPMNGIKNALNSNSVASSFLSGFPT